MKKGKIHFIAIGGSAMHNLAIALQEKGYIVTGSDDAIYEPSKTRLAERGLLPNKLGWFPEKITEDIEAIILGMHAHENNPEMLKAQALGLKIYSYPEYLYEQSKDKTRIVIGGSHGKTTITSMVLHVLHYHGIDVDYMVGAQLEGFDVMVHLTEENEFMIMEGDEYLSSALDRRSKFLLYQPNIALISGISWDHINVFPTFENYKEQFLKFAESIINGGALVYNSMDENVLDIVEKVEKPLKKFPYQLPEYTIEDGTTYLSTEEGPIPLEVFGEHNLMNLEGAKEICKQIGLMEEDFYEAIQSFTGASKRLELISRTKDFIAYKDFAHAPSKVTSVTKAVREQFPAKKIVACLEIHTYSSLNVEFLSQYKDALVAADEKIIFYDPEALKIKRMQMISEDDIRNGFNDQTIRVMTNPEELKAFLQEEKKENKVFLMMSSGSFGGLELKEIFS
ncbi:MULTISPECIES: UDP-N-acetylmuramate--L-alanine ligase [Weeksella]|uniref:UDP-N-acetylmuramate--L-alanine ligase n=1 Tax=Weeksella virosa (strain ATCC 43766 / DSM 16922 / JCM 21250 / CCUG 30538 / CDC 9751 / IAM 14551 / NBRC 16016 / NCTC 11634 / CL345/78) TaxID=865938 RepID=F0NZG4_WEEVC|nr:MULTISPECIES: Mur ligase family protein [Weeksella]ADX68311.1 UDP-N-acetylmuramate--L-alanine ligase [Weeksella virosa DSM 16922]MDK7374586.1 Mur ligase family protein [Weeksella virosa]MDK7674735.1 Mur ligase family protein [Weeksella virosa]OFM83096.1 peptidoglycan synthetase [Weeksella sp. HMSC059D05]SUP54625.1 UDP-N-acetylmuramate:L-alanyl-gamma-D-glutamyl-meso-diaminopimelate ligase [Weeksella virosa]